MPNNADFKPFITALEIRWMTIIWSYSVTHFPELFDIKEHRTTQPLSQPFCIGIHTARSM